MRVLALVFQIQLPFVSLDSSRQQLHKSYEYIDSMLTSMPFVSFNV